MGIIFDLESPATTSEFAPRVPGPVRHFEGVATPRGKLVLRWKPPAGAIVTAYRIERTRDGRSYETVGEVAEEMAVLDPPRGEAWIYRVSAFNTRGRGGCKWVCLYRREDRFVRGGHNVIPVLQHIPVRPGVKITFWELFPSQDRIGGKRSST